MSGTDNNNKSAAWPYDTPEHEEAFVDRVIELNNMARRCAEETVRMADLYPADRNTILRAVIARLKDALS